MECSQGLHRSQDYTSILDGVTDQAPGNGFPSGSATQSRAWTLRRDGTSSPGLAARQPELEECASRQAIFDRDGRRANNNGRLYCKEQVLMWDCSRDIEKPQHCHGDSRQIAGEHHPD